MKKVVRDCFETTTQRMKERNYPFQVPSEYNSDELSVLSDDDLTSEYQMLNGQRIELTRQKYATFLWELELSYLQREIGIRQSRRIAHNAYISQDKCGYGYDYEMSLPDFVPTQVPSYILFN